MMCMAECRESDEVNGDLDDFLRVSNYTLHKQYRVFLQALYDTASDLRHSHLPAISVMVLETIHAMWILSVILRLSFAHGPRSIASRVLERDFAPILRYFETKNMTWDELCDDVYLPGYLGQNPGYWGEIHIRNTYVALDLYRQSISDPAGIDGSGPTVAKIIRLLNEIVNSAYKLSREEASKHYS